LSRTTPAKARHYKGGSSNKPKRPIAERAGSELLSLSEAADIIASTESMVMRLSKQGKLTLVYLGPKTKRVTRKSVYAFLAELTGEAQ